MINKAHKDDSTVGSFLKAVEEAYVNCGLHLHRRLGLPLDNELLKSMSALDPKLRGNSVCTKLLRKLPTFVTNVLTEDEDENYDLEVGKYQVHLGLPSAVDREGGTVRLDTWWASVVKTGLFPNGQHMILISCELS